MVDTEDWQPSGCGTRIDGPGTRRRPNCGGVRFYPLADEVPGDEHDRGTMESDIDLDRVRDHLATEKS